MAEPTLDTLDIHSTDLYVERGYPWKEWDLLRREASVASATTTSRTRRPGRSRTSPIVTLRPAAAAIEI